MQRYRLRLGVHFLLLATLISSRASAESSPDVLCDPPRKTFLLIPLHVHVLQCDAREDLNCKLTDEQVRSVVNQVNGIWHKAGIHFCLGPILHENAANVKAFADSITGAGDPPQSSPLEMYRLLAPVESRSLAGLHVYYIHQFDVNGVFLGRCMCFVKETASLRPVEGGIDQPLPRVTSHELGHAMGLPHRQDITNLMASGTNGIKLNEAEVEIVRARAGKISGAMTIAEFEANATAATSKDEVDRHSALRRELEQLPQ